MCSPGGNWLVACILTQVNYSLRGYLSETDESRCAKGSLTLRNRLSIWKAPFVINTVKVVPFFSHMWMKVGDRLGWTSCKDSRQYCWRQCLQSEKKQPLFSQLFYWKVVHVQFFLFKMHLVKPTWVKHLAHRHSEVPLRFKVLWQSRVVSRMDSPVGIEVIEPGCVRSATG